MEVLRSEAWKPPHSEVFTTVSVKDLPHPLESLSWNTTVEAARDNETVAGAVKAPPSFHVRRLTVVRATLSLLGSTSLRLASLYTLLLPVAQVVRFVPAHLGARGIDRDDLVLPTCLRATESRFPGHFPLWVSATLETMRARLRLEEMVAAIKGVLKAPVAGGSSIAGMNSSGTAAEFIVRTTGSSNGNVTACGDDKNVSVARLSSEDFIGNVILLSRQTRFVDSTEESWMGTHGSAHGQVHQVLCAIDFHNGTLVVPSIYLTEDLMNVGASEPCLDIPTVGVPLLAAWAQGTLSGGQEQSEQFVSSCHGCFPQERDHAMAGTDGLKNGSIDAYLGNSLLVPWAAKVALAACTAMKRNTGKLETKAFSTGPRTTESVRVTPEAEAVAKMQLFFRRLCLMTCGDPAAASACNYVARLPEFTAAFKCTS
ncbi:uncharacterized protein LOC144166541 [Haemaphysalis longicornis]